MDKAEAAIRESRATLLKATGGTSPATDFNASGTRSREAGTSSSEKSVISTTIASGFDSSWELDLWGKTRRDVESSQASLLAATADAAGIRLSLIGEVARVYMELRGVQRRVVVAEMTISAYGDTLNLTRVKFAAGTGSGLDVIRAEALLAGTQAQLPSLHSTLQQDLHRLSVLTGQIPSALAVELAPIQPIPVAEAPTRLGLPADLARRRPDLRVAEWQLAAATAKIGVAEAELYPTLTLSGSLGFSSTTSGTLLEAASRTWSWGPALSLPLFDAGRRRADIQIRQARVDQAEAAWRSAVLTALEDVENALITYGHEEQRRLALVRARDTSKAALDLATELFSRGMISFLDVLDAQRSLYEIESTLAESETAVSTDLVALYKALGGGWAVASEK